MFAFEAIFLMCMVVFVCIVVHTFVNMHGFLDYAVSYWEAGRGKLVFYVEPSTKALSRQISQLCKPMAQAETEALS